MSAPSRRIPVAKLTRVIVDNDYAGDPDGLVALAHQLLTESTEVVAITGTTLTPPHDMPGGVPGSAQSAAREVVQWLTPTTEPAVPADTSTPFLELTSIPDASRVILDEAEKSSDLPLFVTCGGPLTNIAAALREDPTLAERMTLCWIGGGAHPEGGWEYNLALDTPAAQFVFNESSAEIHQFPLTTYRQCAYSIAELEFVLSGGGPFGAWLYERFTNPPRAIRIGDHWPQGDSPVGGGVAGAAPAAVAVADQALDQIGRIETLQRLHAPQEPGLNVHDAVDVLKVARQFGEGAFDLAGSFSEIALLERDILRSARRLP